MYTDTNSLMASYLSDGHGRAPAPEDEHAVVAPDHALPGGPAGPALAGAEAEVPDPPRADVEQAPVHLEPAVPHRLLHDGVGHERRDPLLHVELGHAHGAPPFVADGPQLLVVGRAHGAQRGQPGVQDAADAGPGQRGQGAAARRVAAEHDVADLEVHDGELDHRRRVDVGRADDVGDVAVHKHVARLQAQDRRLGAARVRAAQPDWRCKKGELASAGIAAQK
ncbi:uncharacterized protein E0L32_011423 [Thyridium curvatum]|uniref:Uncharacterized protein n=1 Tax=Thyridium curvatum TaxID=1093900 RepID=A0A507BNM5_9PEZI|nr:uncharacterized protein E0L32_011423 [Thyridium curvatum]TPX18871.1 hypothetical protein E0L32_011423 [Thyridium curvatum]